MSEGYPDNWKHCIIHLNPETGEMHSDGDHSVREWIENKIEQSPKRVSVDANVNQPEVRSEDILGNEFNKENYPTLDHVYDELLDEEIYGSEGKVEYDGDVYSWKSSGTGKYYEYGIEEKEIIFEKQ